MPDDRTARAVIRDEALRLFAARGPEAVTIRQIAAAAGVSPGLVVQHFGSKEGLRQAVDAHVLRLFGAMPGELTGEAAGELYVPGAAGSLAEAVVRYLPPGSPVPAYLRRLEGPIMPRLISPLPRRGRPARTACVRPVPGRVAVRAA